MFTRREKLTAELVPTCTLDRRPKQGPVLSENKTREALSNFER